MAVFAIFDPHDMHWFGQPVEASRQTVYTLCFFGFWAITACASTLTYILSRTPLHQAPPLTPNHDSDPSGHDRLENGPRHGT